MTLALLRVVDSTIRIDVSNTALMRPYVLAAQTAASEAEAAQAAAEAAAAGLTASLGSLTRYEALGVEDALTGHFYLGRPEGSPLTTGSSLNGGETQVWAIGPGRLCLLRGFWVWSKVESAAKIKRATTAGSSHTILPGDVSVTLPGGDEESYVALPGNGLLFDETTIPAYWFATNGGMAYTNATADDGGIYGTSGDKVDETFTDGSLEAAYRIMIRWDFEEIVVTDERISVIEANQSETIRKSNVSYAGTTVQRTQRIGRQVAPTTTGIASQANTWVDRAPSMGRGPLKWLHIALESSGSVTIDVVRWTGTKLMLVDTVTITGLSSGVHMLIAGEDFESPIAERGDFWSVFSTVLSVATVTEGNYWYSTSNGGYKTDYVPAGVLSATYSLQVAMLLQYEAEGAPLNARQLAPGYRPPNVQLRQAVGQGQSVVMGAAAGGINYSTPSTRHLKFNAGIRMTKPGLAGGVLDDDLTLSALVEDTLSPTGSDTYGETYASAFASEYDKAAARFGPPPIWLCSAAGWSGKKALELFPGTPMFDNFVYHAIAGSREAKKLGLSHAVVTVPVIHGESDQAAGAKTHHYLPQLSCLLHAGDDAMKAAIGQTSRIHHLFVPPTYYAKTSWCATEAMQILARTRSDCHMLTPTYHLAHAGDNTHLSKPSQSYIGFLCAEAQVKIDQGLKPDAMEWMSATAVGTAFTAWIRGPLAAQFSTSIIPQTLNGSSQDTYGIRILDAGGTKTLSAFAVGSAVLMPDDGLWWTPITATMNSALGSSPKFRYALDYAASGVNATNGASGNIFGVTGRTFTPPGGSAMPVVYPAFATEMPITVLG